MSDIHSEFGTWELIQLSCSVAVISGVSELTNERRLVNHEGGFKETGAETVSDWGGIQNCSTAQYEKTDVFLNSKACEPLPVVTQNKAMNLKLRIKCFLKRRLDNNAVFCKSWPGYSKSVSAVSSKNYFLSTVSGSMYLHIDKRLVLVTEQNLNINGVLFSLILFAALSITSAI